MLPVLEIKNLSVGFDRVSVLRDINFSVEENKIVAIIGPNGAGKSTLLKAILNLVPFQGEIRMFGKPVKEALEFVGYVPQRFSFDRSFPITVKEFLSLSLDREEGRKRTDSVLEEVEMTPYQNSVMGSLSGGQLQRILIANAILRNPRVLFLDEPTSGIDLEGVKDFYSLIEHMNKEHKVGVFMVSHEVNMVYKFADEILCLNRDLICKGEAKTALTKEILEKLYGEPLGLKEHKHLN